MSARPDPLDNYEGPIRDINGKRPYNGYLWPTESWWAHHCGPFQLHRNCGGGWHFGYVALNDGTFAVDGHVHMIERDNRRYEWGADKDLPRLPNLYPTRLAAIRAAAAAHIRKVRNAARWEAKGERWGINPWGACTPDEIIQWALGIVSCMEWEDANPNLAKEKDEP